MLPFGAATVMRTTLPRIARACVFAALIALLASSPQSTRADDWADCLPQGAPDKIVAACTAVIDQGGRSGADLAKAHARRGFQLERLGQRDRALADFTRAVELDPANPSGYMGRGFYYAQRQDWAKALAEFDQALERAPSDARIHTARGRALLGLGQIEAGIASHNRAIAIDPMIADAFYYRGEAYRRSGDLDRALTDFSRAIALNPKNFAYFGTRGITYQSKGELDLAIADYDRVLALAPQNKRAMELRSAALTSKAELAKTAPPAKPETTVPPPSQGSPPPPAGALNVDVLRQARAAFDRNQFDQAINLLDGLLKEQPNNIEALRFRAGTFLRKGDPARALYDIERALNLKGDDWVAHSILGDVHRVRGDIASALAAYGKAIALNPKAAFALNSRGAIYRDRGELDAALADFDSAIAASPNNSLMYTDRGLALERKGLIDRALADYDRAIALDPGNKRAQSFKQVLLDLRTRQGAQAQQPGSSPAQSLIAQATALITQRKLDEALAILDKAIALDPRSTPARRLRATLYLQKNQRQAALSEIDELVKLNPDDLQLLVGRGNSRRPICANLTARLPTSIGRWSETQSTAAHELAAVTCCAPKATSPVPMPNMTAPSPTMATMPAPTMAAECCTSSSASSTKRSWILIVRLRSCRDMPMHLPVVPWRCCPKDARPRR